MEQGTVDISDADPDGNSLHKVSPQFYDETNIFQQLPSYKSVRSRSKSMIPQDKHQSLTRNSAAVSSSEYTYNESDMFVNSKQPLRQLPINMAEKKRVREKRYCDSGHLASWEVWKQSQWKSLRRLQEDVTHALSWLELWKWSLKEIEGRYGTGIQSYFTFLRFLVFLNLSAFLLVSGFVLLPSIYVTNMELVQIDTERLKNISVSAPECFKYEVYPKGLVSFYHRILDLFSGTGFMEVSYMFYGYYKFGVYEGLSYSLPLAYLLTMIFYFLFCLCWIVQRTMNGFNQESMLESNDHSRQSAQIFTLWDFCIKETSMAELKQLCIMNELKTDLAEQMYKKRRVERTARERAFLYLIRFLLNLFIILVLTGAFYVIYKATKLSQHFQREERNIKSLAFVTEFFMEYLPPIILTTNNILLPYLFWIIIRYEEYSPSTEINLILIRCTFLRLTNLTMLVFSLWQQVTCSGGISKEDCETCGYNIHYQCWETRIGQEMYKLFLFDFIADISFPFCVELPKKLLIEHTTFQLPKILQKQQFHIPENVLNIVNGQTVVWIGMFYSPLLPILNTIKYIIIFYVKKHSLYYYCRPAKRLFRASSSKTFFQLTLLFGLALALIPLVINVFKVQPSRACGPFRYYESAWGIIPELVGGLPQQTQNVLNYVKSEVFLSILIMVLCMVLTTFVALVRANRRTITRLKRHLALAGKDKKYLVKKLSTHSQHQRNINFQDNCSNSIEDNNET